MQNDLFQTEGSSDTRYIHNLGDALISEYPSAFSSAEATAYLDRLINETPWRQDALWIAGKKRTLPRLQCWMGDPGTGYKYSGLILKPENWSRLVLSIKTRVESLTNKKFNSVLLNYYRNGLDSVSWHADDETELGSNPIIGSVSFGVERTLHFRPKSKTDSRKFILKQRHGSVLLMGETLQHNWLHQLPKEKTIKEPRINLTFRYIYQLQ